MKILMSLVLISVILISGCVQGSSDSDTIEQPNIETDQQPEIDLLTSEERTNITDYIEDRGYTRDNISSVLSLTLVYIRNHDTFRNTDIPNILEKMREYSDTDTYSVILTLDKGSTKTDDDTICRYTGSKSIVDELISVNWVGWEDTLTESGCQ